MQRRWLVLPVLVAAAGLVASGMGGDAGRAEATARTTPERELARTHAVAGRAAKDALSAHRQTDPETHARIDALIAALEGDALREDDRIDERAKALRDLKQLITPDVVDAAVQSMLRPAKDHKRAQLILALTPHRFGCEALLDAPDAAVRQYARLLLHGPTRIEELHDPRLCREGTGMERLPVDEIYERVFTPKKDREWKEEYEKDYEREFLPLLRALAQKLPASRRLHVDLDGDGAEELFLDATHLWETGWRHDDGFFVILANDGTINWLFKTDEKSRRIAVADTNGDGVAELYCWVGFDGHGPTGVLGLHAHGGGICRTGQKGLDVDLVDGKLFASSSRYLSPNTGTWGIDVGVMARRVDVHRWDNGFWNVRTMYLPVKFD